MRIRAKTVIVSLFALVTVLVAGAISAIGWQVVLGPDARQVSSERFEPTEARLARGRYLVEVVAHCFECHSEHDMSLPSAPIVAGRKGAGWVMPIPELNNIASRNITPDPDTGLGAWKDDEIARAIREGVRRDGTALFPVMPYLEYAEMSDEDVKSVVVYLRTIPAVRNVVPARSLPFPLEHIVKTMPRPLTQPVPAHEPGSAVARGAYLSRLAECQVCHSPTDAQGRPLPGLTLAGGGMPFSDPRPGGRPMVAVNITRDPSGIAHYDEALFKQVLRTGQMGGRQLTPVMPFSAFAGLTDGDLSDLWAHLQTQPAIMHRVSNTDPPTPCPLCLQSHGLGDRNRAVAK
jgi:mono/diheme cytochrome c family protein